MSVTQRKSRLNKQAEKAPELKLRSLFIEDFYSAILKRYMRIEVILPPYYDETPQFSFRTLYLNDGQQMGKLQMKEVLTKLYSQQQIPPVIVVGLYAEDRMQEYGVAGFPDYRERGSKAALYSRCVANEIVPLISRNFRVMQGAPNRVIAGFSLGALSAFDIAWNYPTVFGTAGAFSASFWWRSKGYEGGYRDDNDRIMHKIVRSTDSLSSQRFWFECGTEDEKADRNHNGVIDSIDDTKDLIHELERLGYRNGEDLKYFEVEGGRHDEATWNKAMPDFLKWAFDARLGKV